ncbi:hypothetical protein BBD46_19840 [Natrialba sp. SSL1]|nr:hypothetical protein BBD46_19840 [Natrialba sp. SSL1]
MENILDFIYRSTPLLWSNYTIPSKSGRKEFENDRKAIQHFAIKTVDRINKVLETEGILWEFEFDSEGFNFRPIGSEMMVAADNQFQSVASGKRWATVASPYNDAYELYRNRIYSKEIPEKLYNSIEELARVICVDMEDWEENRELNLSNYLDIMREKDIFEPNPIMRAEIKDLAQSMEKAFQKVGDERHNRHHEIDKEYCTLILHQTSAYLTYLIRQYESQYSGEE